ncbi:hypothetical protein [Parahaliea mediterranea]|uniref:Secreted protein n=1 Tax=Parahaliea mediterranea TaxID=651086 RepID=A0A939IHH7_9GAMM|nr:hypothetical protein [Parahaliea mediterranea]MBN7795464.1 hypothetical protein [Parahaliea mediterranea]
MRRILTVLAGIVIATTASTLAADPADTTDAKAPQSGREMVVDMKGKPPYKRRLANVSASDTREPVASTDNREQSAPRGRPPYKRGH